jgi:hypothetical protein
LPNKLQNDYFCKKMKHTNKLYLWLLFLAIPMLVTAQEEAKKHEFSYQLYGYVENQINFNSRKNVESTSTLVNIMPRPEKLDANGKDLNAVPIIEMLSINSRIGVDLLVTNILKADVSGKIEADFAGTGSTHFMFRLRQAYINMLWTGKNTKKLLVGQTWHPMVGILPATFEANGGCPFNSFNRSPQLAFSYGIKNFDLKISAIYQMQYLSDGPSGKTAAYLNQSLIPDLFFGFEHKLAGNAFVYGAGIETKTLRPRTESTVGANTYAVDEKITSFACMAYAKYKKDRWEVAAKAGYGQNLTDLLMVGGYGVSKQDAVTGEQEYTAFNSANAWVNVLYGNKLKVGVFAGYIINLGTDKALMQASPIYGYGFVDEKMIDQMYRIEPVIFYTEKKWTVGLEGGLTTAGYGTLTGNGKADEVKNVTNYRVLGVLRYSF